MAGQLIKLVPSNFQKDLYDGHGLILEVTETHYRVLMYDLIRIIRKNMATVVIGQKETYFSIDEADGYGYFEVI